MFRSLIYIVMIVLLSTATGRAQSVLEVYIDSAIANNIVLQQKNISVEKADNALHLAKSMFLPDISLEGGYTTAGGGRNIPLPLGDLLNGAYATLNQLTQSQTFPQLKNESVTFLPTNFYDVKVHTTVPIYNASLNYNKKIRQQEIRLSDYEVEIYKRELVKEVKTGYYRYLQAQEIVEIYASAMKLAEEGKRMNERLLDNGKGLPAYILRAESEIEEVNAQMIEAQQKVDNAARYFNFLLNRPQNSIIIMGKSDRSIENGIAALLKEQTTAENREELSALNEATRLSKNVVDMTRAKRSPSINGFLDLGSQSENWKFDDQSRYYMIGVQLAVPIFTGNKTQYKIKEAQADVRANELKKQNIAQQLEMSAEMAKNNLLAAYHKYLSSRKQLEAAAAYHRLIDRGYREGVNTYIETIDARSQLTRAQLSGRINYYEVLIAASVLERENASYQLK